MLILGLDITCWAAWGALCPRGKTLGLGRGSSHLLSIRVSSGRSDPQTACVTVSRPSRRRVRVCHSCGPGASVLRHSVVSDSVTPRTAAHQAPLSTGFSRQEYWSGLPCSPPGDLPNPWIGPRSPTLQADSLLSEPPGKPKNIGVGNLSLL